MASGPLGGDLVVLGLPLQQDMGRAASLVALHDFRVILYQRTVDTFRLTFTVLAFGVRWLPMNRTAVIKVDGHIAGAAPFAGTGGRADFAGLAAKRLRDYINLALQGQVFQRSAISTAFFLQVGQGLVGGFFPAARHRHHPAPFPAPGGFLLRLLCCLSCSGGRFLWLLLFLGVQLT